MRSLWLSRRVAPAALVSLLSAGFFYAQDEKKAPPAPTDKPAAAPAETPDVDPFKVPEGNDPKVIQEFLARADQDATGKAESPRPAGAPSQGRRHLKQVQEKDLDEADGPDCGVDFRSSCFEILERTGRRSGRGRPPEVRRSNAEEQAPEVVDQRHASFRSPAGLPASAK